MTARSRSVPAALTLFAAMFAAQATLLVLTPVLPVVAQDLGIATATAAQLRSVSGIVAGGVALWVGVRSRPRPLWDVLAGGLGLLMVGSAGSALAPSFEVLALAQAVSGVGLGLVLSSALAAAGEWSIDGRARTLSWALVGQPAAWVVGMPVAGAVAGASWRWAWVAVPLASSLLAAAALLTRPRGPVPAPWPDEPPLLRQPGVRGWAIGELFAYGGWAGTLVFAGALFIDSYGTSLTVVGLLLAGVAVAYVPGNFLARRYVEAHARTLLWSGGLLSAVGVAGFGILRPSPTVSFALLAVTAFVDGGRTIAGSERGLQLAPRCRLQAMSFRTAAVQYGYLLGASTGGVALAVGGYGAVGATFAVLFGVGVVPHLRPPASTGAPPPVAPAPPGEAVAG